jgi:hypothetical protein
VLRLWKTGTRGKLEQNSRKRDKIEKARSLLANFILFFKICTSGNRLTAFKLWVFAVRVTPIFTSKKHGLNTLKIAFLLRNNVMLP